MNRSILISIKPQYVEKIVSGHKKYEFRKTDFEALNIDKIYIYSTVPDKKIIGYFQYGEVIVGSPNDVWEKCSNSAGLSESEFMSYYQNKKIANAYAYKIKHLEIFKDPICPYTRFEKFAAPQNYIYFDKFIELL